MTKAVVQRCSIKKSFDRFSKTHGKTPVLESLSYKVVGCTSATSLKQRLQCRRFNLIFAKFNRTPFLREHLWIGAFGMNI